MFLALLLLFAVEGFFPDEIQDRLSELADPNGAVRHAAERWLAAHAREEHAALLAEAARRGDSETRFRLTHVLARSRDGLDIASAFLAEDSPLLETVGEDAIRERWAVSGALAFPSLLDAELIGDALETWARQGATATIRLELSGDLGEIAALLEREANLFVGLCVEREVRQRRLGAGAPSELIGTWSRVVVRLAELFDAELALYGLPLEGSDNTLMAPAFLCFSAGSEPRESDERIVSWMRALWREESPEERRSAALCLAASRWDDALDWLEERFLDHGDGAALEGLLHAASLERVARSLLDPARVRMLVARAAQDLERSPPDQERVELVLRALRNLPPRGLTGTELAVPVLEGWAEAGAAGRFVRLSVLEGMRSPRGSDPARETLTAQDTAPGLALQALRTWVASGASGAGAAGFEPHGLAELLATPASPEEGIELGVQLARGGFALPKDIERHASLLSLAALLGWALERGEVNAAARIWRALVETKNGDALDVSARALAEWARSGKTELLQAVWSQARQAQELRALIDRVAIRSGALALGETRQVWEGWQKDSQVPEQDLDLFAVIAGLGADPAANHARAALAAALAQAFASDASPEKARPLVSAVERAFDELLKNGFDGLAEEFRREVERLRTQHRRSALASPLHPSLWPPVPKLSRIDLGERSRRLLPRRPLGK